MKLSQDQIRQYVEARLSGQRIPYRAEISLRCPFHQDRTASLSFSLAKGVWKCHAGCGEGGLIVFEQKLNGGSREEARLRVEELLAVDHLFESQKHKPVAVYRYVDAQGILLFEKLRYEPKRFVQRRVLANGKYEYKLEGVEKPLYHLPAVLTANEIFVCEGEKDADNVFAAITADCDVEPRVAATCNFDGAGKWRDEYSRYFLGKKVVIFADNDDAGRKHAQMVAESVHKYALGVKLIHLPGLAEHGDVSDYLAAGHRVEELLAEITETPQWHPQAVDDDVMIEWAQFGASSPPEIDWIVEGVIQRGANGIITGEPKAGKSILALDLLLALGTGMPWLGFPTKRIRVGLVSREDYPGMTAQRFASLFRAQMRPKDFEGWGWINTRWQSATFSLENDVDVNRLIKKLIAEHVEFCVLDVFRRLHSAEENDNTEIQKILDQLVRIQTEANCALALVHHLSKDLNGSIFRRIRGATAIHGWTEWALGLSVTNPEDQNRDWVRRIDFETKAASAVASAYFQIESSNDVIRLVTMKEELKS